LYQKFLPLILFSAIFSQPFPAYAYLDPGTGSILLQGLIGGIAAALILARLYFQKIKSFFRRMFTDSSNT